jgi:hypothetical protein
LLPAPSLAQPEQYQSNEYVTAARPAAGISAAQKRTTILISQTRRAAGSVLQAASAAATTSIAIFMPSDYTDRSPRSV